MTKDLLDSLQSLIDGFNDKNIRDDVFYKCEVHDYHYDSYALTIYYRIFFSTDLYVLMSFCMKNDLLLLAGSVSEGCAYFDLQ